MHPDRPGPHGGAAGEDDGVDFRLVGPDGEPWGEPVEVVGGLRNIGGCAVAYSLDSFVVVWWRASGPEEYNSIWARRVRPRVTL